jgi:hypothetical protein
MIAKEHWIEFHWEEFQALSTDFDLIQKCLLKRKKELNPKSCLDCSRQ